MQTEAYFLSDIHLSRPDEPDAGVLLGFLESIGTRIQASHLFLLGDVFDLWLGGHGFFIRRFSPIVEALKRIASSGVEVHYFEGNHDLYLRDFWQGQLGLRVHEQARLFQIGDLKVRVEHGDLLDPTDRGYRFLRRLLRTNVIRSASRRLPGGLLAGIGKLASRTSRRYTTQHKTISDEGARKNVRRHAERAVRETPFDLIITGHVHVRDDYAFEVAGHTVRSVNLGSWKESRCAFRITKAGQEFVELPLVSHAKAEGGGTVR